MPRRGRRGDEAQVGLSQEHAGCRILGVGRRRRGRRHAGELGREDHGAGRPLLCRAGLGIRRWLDRRHEQPIRTSHRGG
uniref:Uncharacterized protein n=1 Tax=Oryza sativa subsp. japonica TaxID=39947 RepID=Q6L5B1_ORYSJ|nr:unknown protein [Oryza sativa Japonica Group]AAU43986.1 unknown protein [Oryza sativa Japonica Group]